MTWWDHDTESLWSQPWGAAIKGPLAGDSLRLLPSELVSWGVWVARHPDTKVLVDERGARFGRQLPNENFVIGVAIADQAVGYYFPSARADGLVNHQVGDFPVGVFVDASGAIDVYMRSGVGTPADTSVAVPTVLTFTELEDGAIHDIETESTWNVTLGLAVDGPLRGAALQRIPYTSAFDWAWEEFFPGTAFWGEKPILPLPDFFG